MYGSKRLLKILHVLSCSNFYWLIQNLSKMLWFLARICVIGKTLLIYMDEDMKINEVTYKKVIFADVVSSDRKTIWKLANDLPTKFHFYPQC